MIWLLMVLVMLAGIVGALGLVLSYQDHKALKAYKQKTGTNYVSDGEIQRRLIKKYRKANNLDFPQ